MVAPRARSPLPSQTSAARAVCPSSAGLYLGALLAMVGGGSLQSSPESCMMDRQRDILPLPLDHRLDALLHGTAHSGCTSQSQQR
eukprot:5569362-Alexandrium_andersonii.AAC.1